MYAIRSYYGWRRGEARFGQGAVGIDLGQFDGRQFGNFERDGRLFVFGNAFAFRLGQDGGLVGGGLRFERLEFAAEILEVFSYNFV